MLRFASLASGSKGNCLVAESGGTRVLIDCGLGRRQMAQRLARLGLEPGMLSALLLTHEHEDHASGAYAFAAAHRIPLYMTYGTHRGMARSSLLGAEGVARAEIRFIDSRSAFGVGGLRIQPFAVPHDAREPVQYVLSDGAVRLGVLTDLGAPTFHVIATLSGCHGLVLECNHDIDMLWSGGYPRWLKERVAGPLGHIDNRAAARLLGAIERSNLQHVIAAHLSQHNNRPEHAQRALAGVLNCAEDWIQLADQELGFGWRELR